MHGLLAVAMVLAPSGLAPQAPSEAPPARVVALGQGTVLAEATSASMTVSVETRSHSAAEAGQENAARMERVQEALRRAGLEDAITTTGYSLRPDVNRDTGVESYRAHNGVRIELDDVERAGEIIDLAIGAGANRIGAIQFESEEKDDARHEALAMAVTRAREDAEAMAAAAGGRLGALLEITTDWSYDSNNRVYEAALSFARTPIEPGAQEVSAKVRMTWLLEGVGSTP